MEVAPGSDIGHTNGPSTVGLRLYRTVALEKKTESVRNLHKVVELYCEVTIGYNSRRDPEPLDGGPRDPALWRRAGTVVSNGLHEDAAEADLRRAL